jgi:hypothetical protein
MCVWMILVVFTQYSAWLGYVYSVCTSEQVIQAYECVCECVCVCVCVCVRINACEHINCSCQLHEVIRSPDSMAGISMPRSGFSPTATLL